MARVVRIATSADSPPRLRGEVVALDRFSATVALETREAALREGASVWLHFDPPGGGSSLSVAGIVSGMAQGGRITVLLSLSPGEYSRLQGLPDPEVRRGRRAAQPSSLTPPGIKPIQKREAPEPRPEPASPRPAQPTETPSPAPSAAEPDIASLSPIERAKALAAALAEMIGPGGEPASPRPSEPAAAMETVAPPPEPVSVSPVERAETPVEMVEPEPEPVSPSLMEPLEAPPPVVKPSVVRLSLIARAKALAAALAGMAGPRAEPASSTPGEPAEAPVPMIAPPPEPVSASPVESVERPLALEPSAEPAWLRPIEAAEVPVEVVGPPPASASMSPVEPVEAPVEMVEPQPEPVSVSPAEQAEALVARGDLEGAWKVYYDALRVASDDLRLWYGLGLTLSRLNRRKETEEIFQYVVSRGDPGSEDVKHARQWLVRAGSLAEPAAPAVPAAPRSETGRWATVKGRVTWGEPEPPREVFLVLQGLDEDGTRSHTRAPLGRFYEFDGLPPGSYRLIGGVETEWLWDLRFTVEAGQEMVLDLSRENSTSPTAQV